MGFAAISITTTANNDGYGHDGNMFNQSHRGDDRVQREHNVENGDLYQHTGQACYYRHLGTFFYAFQAVVYFMSGLEQQKQAAAD